MTQQALAPAQELRSQVTEHRERADQLTAQQAEERETYAAQLAGAQRTIADLTEQVRAFAGRPADNMSLPLVCCRSGRDWHPQMESRDSAWKEAKEEVQKLMAMAQSAQSAVVSVQAQVEQQGRDLEEERAKTLALNNELSTAQACDPQSVAGMPRYMP